MGFEIVDFLARRAELSPERTALEEVSTGRALSYRALDAAAGRAAARNRRAARASSPVGGRGLGTVWMSPPRRPSPPRPP